MRKKKPKNMRINAENNEFRRKKMPLFEVFFVPLHVIRKNKI